MLKTVTRNSYKKIDETWIVNKKYSIEFEPFEYNNENILLIVELVKNCLDLSLLEKKYRNENRINKMYGHCYHSTQAIYYLMDTDKLIPYSAKDDRNDVHWWLQDGNTIIDATVEQYSIRGVLPPYEKGKVSKWYGWKNRPHKKSLVLIKRILGSYNNAII